MKAEAHEARENERTNITLVASSFSPAGQSARRLAQQEGAAM